MDYQKSYNEIKNQNTVNNLQTSVNVRNVEQKPSFFKENKWAIWLIAISIIIIGLLVLVIVKNVNSPGNANPKISLNIDTPAQIASGSELIYKIQVSNNDSSAIKSVSLDLLYPQGFTFEDSTPKPGKLDGTHFDIASLDPGQNAIIMVKGSIIGNAGETKNLNAILHYRFSNFNSNFVTQSQARTQITVSNVALQFNGPTQVTDGQNVTYTLTYANTADHDLTGLKLNLNIPNNFKVSSFSPQPDIGTTWNLPNLPVNASNTITINGSFNDSTIGDQMSIVAEIDGTDSNGQQLVYSNSPYQVSMVASPLEADLSFGTQSGSGQDIIANPGDTLQFKINYKNNDTSASTGVALSATIDGSAADLLSINADKATLNKNVITWDASQVNDFASLQPNQNGELGFSFKIKNPPTHSNDTNMAITVHTDIQSHEHQQPYPGKDLHIKIATKANITGSAAYVSGANPLSAGSPTYYRVTIALSNSTNDITGGVLTFNMPHAINFDPGTVNSAERNNVSYNTDTKKLTWNVGKLAAHTGDFNPLRKLQFDIEVQPSTNENGQMALASNIAFNGTDSFTQNSISLNLQDITAPQN